MIFFYVFDLAKDFKEVIGYSKGFSSFHIISTVHKEALECLTIRGSPQFGAELVSPFA